MQRLSAEAAEVARRHTGIDRRGRRGSVRDDLRLLLQAVALERLARLQLVAVAAERWRISGR